MNTTSHAIINLAILGKKTSWKHSWLIVLGALLPDAMMFVFFGVERFMLKTPMQVIWDSKYYEPAWQATFDVFNSIPLIVLAWAIAWRKKWHLVQILCASMMLHVLFDLPVHREDAHHHFWPLSNYQFISPVSYWDPAYHGSIFTGFELLLTLMLSVYCFIHIKSKVLRGTIVIINGLMIVMTGYWWWFFG